jgi:hypothetical protein
MREGEANAQLVIVITGGTFSPLPKREQQQREQQREQQAAGTTTQSRQAFMTNIVAAQVGKTHRQGSDVFLLRHTHTHA